MPRSAWLLFALALSTAAYAGKPEGASDAERSAKHEAKRDAMREMIENDPAARARMEEMKELRGQIRDLADDAPSLEGKAKVVRRAEIERLASQMFDLKVAQHRALLDLHDDRADKHAGRIEKKVADKERIIDEKVDAIMSGEARDGEHDKHDKRGEREPGAGL